jgi:hypothetical protein
MLRPGGSSLSLHSCSLRNINLVLQADPNHLIDERLLFLAPSSSALRYNRSSVNFATSPLNVNNTLQIAKSQQNISQPYQNHPNQDQSSTKQKQPPTDQEQQSLISSTMINRDEEGTNKDGESITVAAVGATTANRNTVRVKLYFRRWLILFSFAFITMMSAFNWIEYSIVQDMVIQFYNQSLPEDPADQHDVVNWLSMIYMLCYIEIK